MYFRYNLRAGMAYRTAFLIQAFGMILNNSAFILFWAILFQRIGGEIKGYAFGDVMFLWALAAAGFGLAQVLFGNAGQISRLIYSGELDVYLLQPKPVALNLAASRMIVSGWGDLTYGIILFLFSQSLSPERILLFLLFTILTALVFTATRFLYHSLTFLFGNAESFAMLASEMVLSFMLYPGSIFKPPATWILHSLIPAALVGFIPARIFASFDARLMTIVCAADAALIGVSLLVFYRGLRLYESGNRIGTRL
jgi:ABC-2 type transport system permease protein